MQVKRYRSQRNTCPMIGCGCGLLGFGAIAVVLVGILLILPNLQSLALRAVGSAPVGDTSTILAQATQVPLPIIQNAAPVSSVVIRSGTISTQSISANSGNIVIGNTGNTGALQAQFSEQELQNLCQQFSTYCTPQGNPIRNLNIDLRHGGAILNGEILIPGLGVWQNVQLVVQQRGSSSVAVAGVNVDGTLYSVPPGDIARLANEAEQVLNEALRELVVEAGGASYTLQMLSASDSMLSLSMRSLP